MAVLLGVAMLLFGRAARSEEPDAKPKSFTPLILGDVRSTFLFRHDTNYVDHMSTFGYSMPSVAPGISLTAGVELLPRVALLAQGMYAMAGADRNDAHLRVASGAVLGAARWSFLRWEAPENGIMSELALSAGFGRYLIRETYVNTALAPNVTTKDAGAFGGYGGVEAAVVYRMFRAALGYSYHLTPASIADNIDGKMYAGGSELWLGVGVRL
jgi:hypothetical protein